MADIRRYVARNVEETTGGNAARGLRTKRDEDPRLVEKVGDLLHAHRLACLVDVERESRTFRRWNYPGVARVGLGLNWTGALKIARDDEPFQLVVSSMQEVGQDVVELDHAQVGALVFRRLCSVNAMPSRVHDVGYFGAR